MLHYRPLLCFYSILLFLAYPQTLLYLLLFNLRTPSGISLLPLLLCVSFLLLLFVSPANGIPPLQVDFKKPVKTRHVQFVKFLGEGQSIFF